MSEPLSLDDRLAALSPEKRALLRRRLRERTRERPDTEASGSIPRASREGALPLSSAQRRLWFLHELEGPSATYNMAVALALTGTLNRFALESALGEIVRRHEALRTNVVRRADGQPVQRIAAEDARPVRLTVETVAAPDTAAADAAARRRAREEARRPFDLERDPLLRATLLELGPTRHVLVLVVHHIVADGWSIDVLVRELGTLYRAASAGAPPALPALPIQYADYAAWEAATPAEALESVVSHWRETLRGAPPALEILPDHRRPAVLTYRGATAGFDVPAATVERLRALAEREGASLFMAALAGLAIVLGRHAGQDDVVIGCAFANRRHPQTQDLIGLFVNVLPLRVDLSGDGSFRELLRRARRVAAAAQDHQAVPFDRLVDASQPGRDTSRTPIFQAVLGYRNAAEASLELPGLAIVPWEIDTGTAKFELTVFVEEGASGWRGTIEYNADLYDPATVARLAEHLAVLLASAVADPDRPVAELELLSERERRILLDQWAGTRPPYPREATVPELFAAVAARTPDAIALAQGDRTLTYAELDRRANGLAGHLRARGITPGTRVGICAERSFELIVGLLGILKVGAVYVPLDPAHPAERLAFMLADTGAPLVLTGALDIALPPGTDRLAVTDAIAARHGETAPPAPVAAGDPAYVMYTSGSTGEPKGAVIPHRAIVRLVRGTDYVSLDASETLLQLAPISFDASTFEIWGALLNGARLVLAPPPQPSLSGIGELIRDHGVTTLWLTTGLFNLMVDEQLEGLVPLRQLLTGGEALSIPRALRAARALAGGRVINAYGPTENTTFTTWHPVDPDGDELAALPIGRPIANTSVYVLDGRGRLAPIGVAGELHAGGDGVGLGYLNRPELTAERFVPDPFGPGRLYRSGDVVRWVAGGRLEFLGRRDDQVKIRGFRVEPGEIEAALLARPEVRQAVVAVHEPSPGRKELCAYVVPAVEGDVAETLFAALRASLPEFLVPAAIVTLAAIPLTPNGKVDRRALPAPDRAAAAGAVAPRTPAEAEIAEVFGEVLGLGRVGARDRFFELGGNSLLATQLVARLRSRLGVDVPLRQVFETPDVEGLARALDASPREPGRTRGDGIARVERGGSLPLSFAQERLWFLHRLEPDNPFYNVTVALRIAGDLDAAALERGLGDLVRRHEVLRTTYHEVDGRPVQRIHDDVRLPLARVDLRGVARPDDEVVRRVREESRRPCDLAAGPVMRAILLVLGEGQHVLMVTIHHIAADGWSMGVLVRELTARYLGRDLPPIGVQYADFAAWQRRRIEGDVHARQAAYWKRTLDGCPSELALPTDRRRPPVQSFRGGSVRFEVDGETTRRLLGIARAADATPFMLLLAAFGTLLARYANQDDLVIGSPIANRTRTEVEPLIGFFVNTLALRLDLGGDPTFAELLRRTRDVALEAYAHQDLPFERLVDELQPTRDLSRNPLFQVMFALQNAPLGAIELPGLAITPVDHERTAAQFDLVLDMWETGPGLLGVLEFSVDLFDHATIDRMVEHFKVLLGGIAADPDARLWALPLLAGAERRALLDTFNANRAAFPVDRTLHALFEAEVAAGGERIAAEHGAERISYAALDARANRIAHRLRRLGVGRNDFVGLLLERSIDFLAAMLGVLKAGAAYVPIDPSYPRDRIAYMIANSAPPVLITRADTEGLAAEGGPRRLVLDRDDLSGEPETAPDSVNAPADRAYMLYTSGSTGLPKGAILRHDGKINHIYGQIRWLGLDRETVFLQSAPSSSDISVWQFLGPLLVGGRTIVADYETLCEPPALWALIRSRGVTIVELVPVAMAALLEHAADLGEPERRRLGLRWAMATGEAVSPALVNRWIDLFPWVPIVNAYGPTEAADDVCQHVVTTPLPPDARSVPIGTPLANLWLYVLDRTLGLAPIGVPGEIAVSGIGVGEGYWNEPARTAESFVPNPYADGGRGAVLYRTGDVGYWRPDGVLECLSRLDDQVKVRGFRIELGEIEAAVGRHPAVRDVVVVAREDGAGDVGLAAYLVPNLASADVAGVVSRLRGEQVDLWQDLHENDYRGTLDYGDPTFNVIGWDSSYDNQPLPIDEMREYVNGTVARILALGPRKLLEIGCGTGLLMFPLLPHLEAYAGLDLSSVAIERLRALQRSPDLCARVRGLPLADLRAGRADDLSMLEPGSVDTVIFPSVVQYFPGADYLLSVLAGVLRVVRGDGTIFLGDVRSLPLLPAFHASVQLFRSDDALPVVELVERIREREGQEQELALDPAFFTALRRRFPRIRDVEILPKRGLRDNEMTRFRYDVVLRLGVSARRRSEIAWHPWTAGWSAERLRDRLAGERPETLGLSGVPNDRVRVEAELRRLLGLARRPATVGDLRAALRAPAPSGVAPESLRAMAEDLGYAVHLSLARSGPEGRLDVAFVRADRAGDLIPVLPEPDGAEPGAGHAFAWPGARHANDPLSERLARALVPRVRDYLRDRIPQYMVPADVVVLERLPLGPSGKVDRRALPAPPRHDAPEAEDGPRTAMETALAAIWGEVLGRERCGISRNFFELGGHSLKATQVVSRIRQRLGVELPLRTLFSHPTIAELAGQIDAARPPADRSIPRVPDASHHPLSPAQRRLWVLAQLDEGSVAYNMPAAILLEGPLQAQALERALAAVVARHESLRTTFALVDGEPRQVIHDGARLSLRTVDLSAAPDPDARAREQALADAADVFDLEAGPLVRASLLRLAPERHVLLFNAHHVIADDWSLGVLVREVMRAYGGLPLPPLRIQYRDFAAWQTARLETGAAGADRDYWLGRFAGEIPILELPADHVRPPVKTYRGRTIPLRWDAADTRALGELARRHGSTVFMTLVAVVKTLLHRYTGQTDLVVAAPVAGRDHPDLEDQIGFYINTLALRDTVRPDAPFAELLAEVTRNTTAALEHQGYPFDRLIGELPLRHDPSRMPLADVVVLLQNTGTPDLSLPGIAVGSLVDDYPASKYDLHFVFEEREGVLRAAIVYNPDLFGHDRIERMAGHLRTLLKSVLADPRETVGRLAILPDEERRRLLVDFNPPRAPRAPRAPIRTVVEGFEAQAARAPGREAVCLPSMEGEGARRALTYGQLDAAANRLARQLRARGVGPGVFVGLFATRSIEAVAGLLGILKAGGAYVPIDPAYPRERIAFMIADARMPVLVTDKVLGPRLGDVEAEIVWLDGIADPSTERAERPADGAGPDDVAYVIYTSGSTGRPKGVMVTHANAARLFGETHPWFGFGDADVWTLFHSLAFDFSVWEIWGALLHGGRLVVVPQAAARAPEAFHALLARERVTVLNQTPSAFRALIEADERAPAGRALALRHVIFGGEALDLQSLRPWFERHGDATPRLVNMYGITETTVHVTYRPLGLADLASPSSVVGVPIPDLALYILDPSGNPAPIGVPGEIHVGGAGVARGYWNRAELTAERFVANPFGEGRLYRSGDLGRYRPDGDVEYLGRIDHQVKIRGFRIELGEIEAALTAHASVRQAVVVARAHGPDRRLVAYVVAGDGGAALVPALRGHLRERLPEYMIPAAIVPLAALPLTAHGKIDREALPDPAAVPAAPADDARPRTAIEQALAEVMCAMLGVERIGLDVNFFDLGAQSLLLVRAHARLQERLGRKIPLIALYQHSTVATLAGYLASAGPAEPSPADGDERGARRRQAQHARAALRGDRRDG